MCNRCGQPAMKHVQNEEVSDRGSGLSRRHFTAAGIGGAASFLLPSLGSARAQSQAMSPEIPSLGYAIPGIGKPLERFSFTRRSPRSDEVLIDILYAGICHTDVHTQAGDLGPVNQPVVPGHEIVGRVSAVGASVSKFRVGDAVGVGCLINSCGVCDYCKRGLEQYCVTPTFTYGSGPDGVRHGGYATNFVVKEKFALKIPASMDLSRTAPLLCAGVTTFSPLQHWRVTSGQKVAMVGLGGLGHMAVKLLKARGSEITVFTTTPGKRQDALRLGASQVVVWPNPAEFERLAAQFDFMLTTVPTSFELDPFLPLLKPDATMVNVGAVARMTAGYDNVALMRWRKSIASSLIGGIAETQELLEYCARNDIHADVEVIPASRIDEAYRRVIGKDVKFRFVIDVSTMRA